MHTLKVMLLNPAGARRATTVAGMTDWLKSAVARVRPLRWRLVTAPLHYGGYGWGGGGSVGVSAPLYYAPLHAPRGRAAVDAVCGQLIGGGLGRRRPPWGVWVGGGGGR